MGEPMTEDTIHWLFTGLIGAGGAVIAWLLNRAVAQQDEKIDEAHDGVKECRGDITDLKVGVAKALAGNDALSEQMRVLRHDVREVKHGVDGIAKILMGGK